MKILPTIVLGLLAAPVLAHPGHAPGALDTLNVLHSLHVDPALALLLSAGVLIAVFRLRGLFSRLLGAQGREQVCSQTNSHKKQ